MRERDEMLAITLELTSKAQRLLMSADATVMNQLGCADNTIILLVCGLFLLLLLFLLLFDYKIGEKKKNEIQLCCN